VLFRSYETTGTIIYNVSSYSSLILLCFSSGEPPDVYYYVDDESCRLDKKTKQFRFSFAFFSVELVIVLFLTWWNSD